MIGNEPDDENIILSEFAIELIAINNALKRIDYVVSGYNPSLFYKIINVSKKSPLEMELEASPIKPEVDYSNVVIDRFLYNLNDLNEGRKPDCDMETLMNYGNIGSSFGKHLTKMKIMSNGSQVELNKNLKPYVKKILGKDEILNGFVSGILEGLNIHGENKKFFIYPVAGADKIECVFPNELIDVGIHSVNKYLNLYGELKYKKGFKFPYFISVKSIEIYPDENELPTFFDIKGIAPNATGNLSSEEFIRRLRENA
jgi:hypothetical protein